MKSTSLRDRLSRSVSRKDAKSLNGHVLQKFVLLIVALLLVGAAFSQSTNLWGKIIDYESKEPIIFGSVSLYEADSLLGKTETDLDGNYVFSNLNAGTYEIQAEYPGYREIWAKRVILLPGKIGRMDLEMTEQSENDPNQNVNYQLIPSPEISKYAHRNEVITHEGIMGMQKRNTGFTKPDSLTNSTYFTGKVLDADEMTAIIFATVSLYKYDKVIQTTEVDFLGNYILEDPNLTMSKGYSIEVTYPGYHSLRIKNVQARRADTTLLNMKIKKATFPIETESKIITNPLMTIWSSAYRMESFGLTTRDSGDIEITLAYLSTIPLSLESLTYHTYKTSQFGSISGLGGKIIKETTGLAPRSTVVELYQSKELLATTRTDIHGNYYFTNLPPGKYRLETATLNVKLIANVYVNWHVFTVADLFLEE